MLRIIIFTITLLLFGCVANEVEQQQENQPTLSDIQKLPKPMKGYELTSWQENGEWHFCLVNGTNRVKTKEEITKHEYVIEEDWAKINVIGVDSLKELIAKIPEKTNVFWGSLERDNGVPDRGIVYEIIALGKKHNVEIHAPFYSE